MEIVILCIPFVVAIILLIFFRQQTVWWEYLILIVPSLLLGIGLEWVFKRSNTLDTEYLGDYVTKIRHEDSWNEWIKKTCTRTVKDGVDKDGKPKYREESYDCSYCEDHPERWIYYTNSGRVIYTTKDVWEDIRKRLAVPMVFIDMHRKYYTKDGDAQEYNFSGDPKRSQGVTWKTTYVNPVLGSRSLFNFPEVPDNVENLYEYPEISGVDQDPVIGVTLTPSEDTRLRWLNAKNGEKYQFRLYTLFWKDSSPEVASDQRDYWKGGNKNELVVCIGLCGDTRTIRWVRCFSWEDSPVMSTRIRMWLENRKKFNGEEYAWEVEELLRQGLWKRKHFRDFDYLSIELTDGQILALLIIVLIYNICISIWIIQNEFTNVSIDC